MYYLATRNLIKTSNLSMVWYKPPSCRLHYFRIMHPTIRDPTIQDSCINYVFAYQEKSWSRKTSHGKIKMLYWIIWIGLNSFSLRQKADEIKDYFFSPIQISFRRYGSELKQLRRIWFLIIFLCLNFWNNSCYRWFGLLILTSFVRGSWAE